MKLGLSLSLSACLSALSRTLYHQQSVARTVDVALSLELSVNLSHSLCGLIGRWTDGLISWLLGLTGVIDYPLVTDCRDSLILFAGSSIGTRNSDWLHGNHKLIRFVPNKIKH